MKRVRLSAAGRVRHPELAKGASSGGVVGTGAGVVKVYWPHCDTGCWMRFGDVEEIA